MKKILLVEDNELNRDMLSRRLERKGFQVVIAENGEQGVALARSERPDLILMDMNLPVLDGWQATQLVKGDALTRHIPVIGLTAHAMIGDRERVLETGCDEYAAKPVDFTRLMEKINHLLGGKRDERE